MVQVKICGITNAEDARFATQAGADAIGFIFYNQSPRYVQPEAARSIISEIEPFVTTVGVFVNTSTNKINEIAAKTGIQIVQLSGYKDTTVKNEIHLPVIQVIHIDSNFVIDEQLLTVDNNIRLMIDSKDKHSFGGSGKTADWEKAAMISVKKPVILAGGLTPENVREAIQIVKPVAVDVSSGVEKKPGIKDHKKVTQFIRAAKNIS